MWIALLPFFTKILSAYNTLQLSVALYAVDQAAAGGMLTVMWLYASKNHRFIDKNISQTEIRFTTIRSVIVPLLFLLSIGISIVSTAAASFSWYLLIPIYAVVLRLESKREKQQEKQREVDATPKK
jgi:uncharacterized membrane protein